MSAAWVIDSSVGFSWVCPGQATPETDRLLADLEQGTRIFIPLLWFVEIANGLLVLQRRKRITAAERKAAIERLARLQPVVDEPSARTAFGEASALAEKYGLTVYDATYLELAVRRGLRLASRDEALCAAAKKCGVGLL